MLFLARLFSVFKKDRNMQATKLILSFLFNAKLRIYFVFLFLLFVTHASGLCEQKRIVICTASYKNAEWYTWNLDSVFNQKYENWHLMYVDDCSPDSTGELVKTYVKERGFEDKVTVICNKVRRKAMANYYTMISMCAPQDIIVILDGDDRLISDDVLQVVNYMYTEYNVWLTHGHFRDYPSGKLALHGAYPAEVIQNNAFRSYPGNPSHLRTFYAGLFHKIKLDDLMYNGEFFPTACDLAMMFPMIEMARDHFLYCAIPLLEYNMANVINDHRVALDSVLQCDKIIRSLRPYDKIESPY